MFLNFVSLYFPNIIECLLFWMSSINRINYLSPSLSLSTFGGFWSLLWYHVFCLVRDDALWDSEADKSCPLCHNFPLETVLIAKLLFANFKLTVKQKNKRLVLVDLPLSNSDHFRFTSCSHTVCFEFASSSILVHFRLTSGSLPAHLGPIDGHMMYPIVWKMNFTKFADRYLYTQKEKSGALRSFCT